MSEITNNTTTIEILDKHYEVKCPKEEIAELQETALYLSEKMREIRDRSTIRGFENIALMAALNVAHDYINSKKQQSQYVSSMSKRIKHLHEKVELALSPNEQLEL